MSGIGIRTIQIVMLVQVMPASSLLVYAERREKPFQDWVKIEVGCVKVYITQPSPVRSLLDYVSKVKVNHALEEKTSSEPIYDSEVISSDLF